MSSTDALQAKPAEPNAAWHKALGDKQTAAALAELPAGPVFNEVHEPR